jgi:hypothetical protein
VNSSSDGQMTLAYQSLLGATVAMSVFYPSLLSYNYSDTLLAMVQLLIITVTYDTLLQYLFVVVMNCWTFICAPTPPLYVHCYVTFICALLCDGAATICSLRLGSRRGKRGRRDNPCISLETQLIYFLIIFPNYRSDVGLVAITFQRKICVFFLSFL